MNKKEALFLLDKDRANLKEWGQFLIKEFPRYDVIAFDNWGSLREELDVSSPLAFLIEVDEGESEFRKFIQYARKEDSLKNISILVFGKGKILESHHSFLKTMNCETLEKPFLKKDFQKQVQRVLSEGSVPNFETLKLKANDILFEQGESAEKLYILKSGKMCEFLRRDGETFITNEIKYNEVFGKEALFEREKRKSSVKAIEACELLSFRASDFHLYLKRQPFWFQNILDDLIDLRGKLSL